MGEYAHVVGVQVEGVKSAMEHGFEAKEIFKGTNALKAVKGVSIVAETMSIGTAAVEWVNNPTKGNGARVLVRAAAAGAAFIPIVGWGLSLGIGIADAIWGEDFYKWIDKH